MLNSIGHFRLYSKTEQLEQLMGEEVTDINEILAVINNIQVQLHKRESDFLIFNNHLFIQASQTLLSPKVVGQAQQVNQVKLILTSQLIFVCNTKHSSK